MDSREKTINYQDGDLTVHWKPKVCIHSEICVKGLPNVFRPNEKPWIDLSSEENQSIANRVDKCPSGALSYSWKGKEKSAESSSDITTASIMENGPLLIQGELKIKYANGEELTKSNPAICRCGASSNKPFCDGTHAKVEFKG